jgi:GT2 family glycosyltransferase
VVSNNSEEERLFTLLKRYQLIYYEMNVPFNYSQLMNDAASKASGDFLLFLNNDTEVITPHWLQEMVGQAARPTIGAVGCKLLYFNDTIQHAGIVLGIKERIAEHLFVGELKKSSGLFNTIHNYSAVTAACMMCQKARFYEVGGFDEELKISFNDIDFCLKLREKGYHNIYLPHVELYHYESLTRGSPRAMKKKNEQFAKEFERMEKRWPQYLEYDPCSLS